ncbi:hypothetical protein [Crystallibacter degradans]|uniref:hypothetical protein n=1 Tax=Crystallibacter degradans TaxID=2726743 RepID=UPI00197BA408|nr:hypothetical protein [Arthrobacter sp. SF27]
MLLLAVAGSLMSGAGSDLGQSAQEAIGVDPMESGVGMIFTLPFLLVGMAFLGPVSASGEAGVLGMFLSMRGEVWAVPVLLTVLAALSLWWLGRHFERKAGVVRTSQRWILAATTGLALAVIAVGLAILMAVRSEMEAVTLSIDSASAWLFLGAFVIGAVCSVAGRHAGRTKTLPAASATGHAVVRTAQAVRVFGWHLLAYMTVAGMVLFVAAATEGGTAAAFTAPLWLPTAAAWAYGAGHLSGLNVFGQPETTYVFEAGWWQAALLLLLTVLAALAASLLWSQRRGTGRNALEGWYSWLTLPVVFACGGAAVGLMTTIVATAAGSFISFSGAMGLAGWTFLVMGIWGGIIEVSARYLAPTLAPYAPAKMRGFLTAGAPSGAVMSVGSVTPAAAHPVADSAAAGRPGPAENQPTPLSASAKKRLKIAAWSVGAVAVVGIGAGIAYNILATGAYGPQAKVEQYLTALQNGEASTATALLDPNVATAERVLFNDEIFAAAENRITGFSIRDVVTTEDTAMVVADVVQDAKTTPLTFELEQEGRTAVVFKDWRIASGGSWSLPLELPAGRQDIKVNGVAVEIAGGQEDFQGGVRALVPVLPGDYVVSAPEGTKYISYGSEQAVRVPVDSSAQPETAVFEQAMTDAVAADAAAQANAYLAKCIEAKELQPQGCPNAAFAWRDDENYRAISWKLETEPEYDVSRSWLDDGLMLTARNGEVSLNYEENVSFTDDREEWKQQETTRGLLFNGAVSIDGDKLTVTFD